jgi:hypothetical protein
MSRLGDRQLAINSIFLAESPTNWGEVIMSSETAIWHFCNSKTQRQSPPMSVGEAQLKCADIHVSDISFWYVWQNGWPAWKQLSEVPELLASINKTAAEAVPFKTPGPAAPRGERRHPRFNVRLRIIVSNNQQTFRTFSKVVSMGGLSLEEPVPEHIVGQSQMFIALPNQSENVVFDIGPTAGNDRRFLALVGGREESSRKLQQWLERSTLTDF